MKLLIFAVGGSALLGGCAGMELGSTRGLAPQGSDFNKALYAGYVKLSQSEFDEGDYRDSDAFAVRANSTVGGAAVDPEGIEARKLPAGTETALSSARGRLIAALESGARIKLPERAAHAQVMFDCWMQEQEENIQPEHIAACRDDFTTTLVTIEDALKPKKVAAPEPAPIRGAYKVSFAFDSSELAADQQATIDEIVAAVKKMGSLRLRLAAHADRAGSDAYNIRLSERRAAAVKAALVERGVSDVRVDTQALGEEKSPVPTEDGVREAGNRIVVVTFTK